MARGVESVVTTRTGEGDRVRLTTGIEINEVVVAGIMTRVVVRIGDVIDEDMSDVTLAVSAGLEDDDAEVSVSMDTVETRAVIRGGNTMVVVSLVSRAVLVVEATNVEVVVVVAATTTPPPPPSCLAEL